MTESVSKICRICLEQLGENEHFNFLNNDNGSMLLSKLLDFLPEMDLDFVRNPISCYRCTITIDQIHDFKNLCAQTESVLKERKNRITFVRNEPEIEIIKEEFLKDEYTIKMAESVSKVCRICLEQIGENEHFHFLNNDNGLMLLSKLLDFLPEINLDFVQNPISCNQCTITIDQIHEFKNLCLQTESIIKDLRMQQKTFDDVTNHVKKDTEIETIKEEFFEDRFKNEPLIVDDDCLRINTDLPVCVEVPTKLLHIHTGEKPYKCDVCDYRSNYEVNLKFHIRTHTREKQYKCDVCDYRSNNKSYLKQHIHTHTREKPFKCNVCDYRSNYKTSLKIHIRTHTEEKQYKCDVCDYRSNYEVNLKIHIRTHTGEKPYKCDVCDYRSNHKSHLKQHIHAHTGEKPYKCDVCDYRCLQKSSLKRHIQTHTGEKPYKCNVCDYCCIVNCQLKKHMLMHTGEKLFKCDVCDYRCNQKWYLKRHIQTHTGEKPYKCDVCDYRCNQKSHLKSHIRVHDK